MRQEVKEFVGIVSRLLPIHEPIFEFGSLQVEGQEGFADLRQFFPGKQYVGCDMRPGPGVDRILDLHDLAIPPNSVGTALVLETLEHVEFPRRALEEVHRVLKPDGIVVTSSLMKFPIHNHPYDYWRFTPEGFASLLRPFGQAYVASAGSDDFPHTVVGVGFKTSPADSNAFAEAVERWKWEWADPEWPKVWYLSKSKLKAIARLSLPPGIIELSWRLRKRLH